MIPETTLLIIVLVLTALLIGPGSYFLWAGLRRIPPSVYAEMETTMSDMNRQMAEMRAQQQAAHAEMRKLQVRVTDLEIGVKVLSAQVVRLGGTPEFTLSPAPPAPVPMDDRTLTAALTALFNRDEVDDLAFRLGINHEEISGETAGKRARSLVAYAKRHSMTDNLIELARQLRPEGDI